MAVRRFVRPHVGRHGYIRIGQVGPTRYHEDSPMTGTESTTAVKPASPTGGWSQPRLRVAAPATHGRPSIAMTGAEPSCDGTVPVALMVTLGQAVRPAPTRSSGAMAARRATNAS